MAYPSSFAAQHLRFPLAASSCHQDKGCQARILIPLYAERVFLLTLCAMLSSYHHLCFHHSYLYVFHQWGVEKHTQYVCACVCGSWQAYKVCVYIYIWILAYIYINTLMCVMLPVVRHHLRKLRSDENLPEVHCLSWWGCRLMCWCSSDSSIKIMTCFMTIIIKQLQFCGCENISSETHTHSPHTLCVLLNSPMMKTR